MSILRLIIFVLISVFSISSFPSEVDERRKEIVKIINEEIQEVSKLSSQSRGNNPDLYLRLAELNLEKARLFREKENEDFLDIPAKKRSKISKRKFFSNSSRYFKRANDLSIQITKKFKNYSRIGEVYYVLGYYAKEANNSKLATRYLKLSDRKTKTKETKLKTQISLAEVYYNDKKYRQAIPLYEKALRNKVDKWWTKDAFNLAWCYFRANRVTNAINQMEDVFKYSSKSKFIDMRAQVERDIGLFYATGNKIDRGVRFYKKIGINFTDQLLRIALALLNQGKYDRAAKVLVQAVSYEKNEKKLVEIYIEQLNLHQKFGKYQSHFQVVEKLKKLYSKGILTPNQKKTYIFQMEKVAALLQRQAIGKTYSRLKKARIQKALLAISYFKVLSHVDKTRSDEFSYLIGETSFSVGLYTTAYTGYKDTYEYSEKKKNNKFRFKAIEGMLAVLAKQKNNTQKNIYVFESYLKEKSKTKRSVIIYERLFNNYLSLNQYDNAKNVLVRFSKNFPRNLKQEAMIAKLMDIDRKNKNNARVRAWIKSIESGEFYASSKYKLKLQELLTTLQIEDVQGELSKGNKKVALVGYLDILKDPYATKKSKVNAKYNLAALYYELGDVDNSYKWSVSALNEMQVKDVSKFSGSFVTISNFLFSALAFDKSADLSSRYYSKLCSRKSKSKITSFKNAAFIYLADGKLKEAEGILNTAKKCKVPVAVRRDIEFEIMKEYKIKQDWNRYEYYVNKLRFSSLYYYKVIDDFIALAQVHKRFNNDKKVQRFLNIAKDLYYKAKKSKKDVSLGSLDFFSSTKISEMDKTVAQFKLLRFGNLKNFKKDFDRMFSKLQLLEKQAQAVIEIGSGSGILNAYRILHTAYNDFGKKLDNSIPDGLKKEHIQSFKKDLEAPIQAARSAAKTYFTEANKAIESNQILSDENFYFQSKKFPIKYFSKKSVTLMDRGGN